MRLRGILVAGPCFAVLLAAAWLQPTAGGYGTHEQLGIPPCSFLTVSGWPCPSCGLTTSFSATTHGQLALAWQAQPFGIVLFAAVLLLAIVGSYELVTARSSLMRLRPGVWWAWCGLIGLFAGWGYKLLVGWLGQEYPLR